MQKRTPLLLLGCAVLLTMTSALRAADEKYAAPSFETVRDQSITWAKQQNLPEESLTAINELWTAVDASASAQELLDAAVHTFALANPDIQAFVDACQVSVTPVLLPDTQVLDAKDNEFVNSNLRLYFARFLSRSRLYDEALEQFSQIDPRSVIDPATSLFYTAVCQQQLLQKTEGLATLDKLLTKTENVPVRYSSVAQLMQYELQNLRQDSLDEVAFMMKDVERRLDLGRGGRQVQKKEAEIIAALDYLIEKLEQQNCSGSCPCNGNAPGRNNQSSSPAKDSSVKGAPGPGNADRRNVANKGGWGALPEKEQAAAKQHADEKYPPHYNKIIEEYNKRMAERKRN
jgi:hypothetical protein